MGKLFTAHDRFHIHALLGFAALVHFAVRFKIALVDGTDSFSAGPGSAILLTIHVLLHATSFQLPLPAKRQLTQPMIWPEYRAHNAIFAYRHIVCTALGVWWPEFWYRGSPSMLAVGLKILILLLACWAADIVTQKMGSKEIRTTNAMPYPASFSASTQASFKLFYAETQLKAAAMAVFGPPTLSFGCMFGIEFASFAMTLVRKGKIDCRMWHVLYFASLVIVWPLAVAVMLRREQDEQTAIFRAMFVYVVARELRFERRWSNYITWAVAVPVGSFLAPFFLSVMSSTHVRVVILFGIAWSFSPFGFEGSLIHIASAWFENIMRTVAKNAMWECIIHPLHLVKPDALHKQ